MIANLIRCFSRFLANFQFNSIPHHNGERSHCDTRIDSGAVNYNYIFRQVCAYAWWWLYEKPETRGALWTNKILSENVLVIDDPFVSVYRIFVVCTVYRPQVGHAEESRVTYLYDENSVPTNFIIHCQISNWIPALISLTHTVGFRFTYSVANWTDYSELMYLPGQEVEEWVRIRSEGKPGKQNSKERMWKIRALWIPVCASPIC